jgi:hypothetical protein
LIVDHEFRLLMLTETRRFLGDDDAEDRARMPADERIAKLAAKMTPNDAEDLLRAWHDWKNHHVEGDLREIYSLYREERRDRGRLELERIVGVGESNSDREATDGV